MKRTILSACVAAAVLAVGVTAAVASTTSLDTYVLRNNEQPGFARVGKLNGWPTAKSFVRDSGEKGAAATRDVSRLRKLGYAGGLGESLSASGHRQAFSDVLLLKSTAAAQTLALAEARLSGHQGAGTYRKLTIPGISSAHGWEYTNGKVGDSNIYWVAGHCALGAGDFDNSTRSSAAPVIAGVKALRKRIHNRCS